MKEIVTPSTIVGEGVVCRLMKDGKIRLRISGVFDKRGIWIENIKGCVIEIPLDDVDVLERARRG